MRRRDWRGVLMGTALRFDENFRGGGGGAVDEEVDISDAFGKEGRGGMGGMDGAFLVMGFDFPLPRRWRGRKGDSCGREDVECCPSSLCPTQAFGSASTAVAIVGKVGFLSLKGLTSWLSSFRYPSSV